jgi:hypothetical protein
MTDPTEEVRRALQAAVNSGETPRIIKRVPKPKGQTWTTEQLQKEFEVQGFMAPLVVVRRKSDGVRGTLTFRHAPRVYFDFEPT